MNRLVLVSDAWHPQVNGVVRTLDTTRHELEKPARYIDSLLAEQASA